MIMIKEMLANSIIESNNEKNIITFVDAIKFDM